MNLTIKRGVWLLDVMTYFACAIALAQAAEPQKKKAKQEAPALKQARQEEATARAEENSREMARSATREIARAAASLTSVFSSASNFSSAGLTPFAPSPAVRSNTVNCTRPAKLPCARPPFAKPFTASSGMRRS